MAAFIDLTMRTRNNFCKVSLVKGRYCYEPLEKGTMHWATRPSPKHQPKHVSSSRVSAQGSLRSP